MNQQVQTYLLEVEDLDAPRPEKLHLLYRRDGLFEIESELSSEEQAAIREADRKLLQNITAFASCTDFSAHRQKRNIPSTKWWWYLDVISCLMDDQLAVAS